MGAFLKERLVLLSTASFRRETCGLQGGRKLSLLQEGTCALRLLLLISLELAPSRECAQ